MPKLMFLLLLFSIFQSAAFTASAVNPASSKSITPAGIDKRTFDELNNEAQSRIPKHLPEWTDTKEHDPGRTLLDIQGKVNFDNGSTGKRIPTSPPLRVKYNQSKKQPKSKYKLKRKTTIKPAPAKIKK
jgi:hypothetical protein